MDIDQDDDDKTDDIFILTDFVFGDGDDEGDDDVDDDY